MAARGCRRAKPNCCRCSSGCCRHTDLTETAQFVAAPPRSAGQGTGDDGAGRSAGRTVPAGARARSRRHGHGLARRARRRRLRAAGGAEAAARRVDRPRAGASAWRASARCWRRSSIRTSRSCTTPAGPRRAGRTWRSSTSTAQPIDALVRAAAARRRSAAAAVRRRRPRGGVCARAAGRASRPEAEQRAGHRRGPGASCSTSASPSC